MADYFNTRIEIGRGETSDFIMSGNICYYAVTNTDVEDTGKEVLIPPIEEVISINYFPYLPEANLVNDIIDLDSKFIPPTGTGVPKKVRRISKLSVTDLTVKIDFIPFNYIEGADIGGTWKWQNEGRLWMSPFHYNELYDGISSPITYKSELFADGYKESSRIRVRQALNSQGIYQLYLDGYKGDTTGLLFGEMTGGNPLPTSNSAYLNYLSSNQSQITMGRISRVISGVSSATSLFNGDVGGAISGVTSSVMGEIGEIAKQTDMREKGLSVKDTGADVLFNLQVTQGLKQNVYGYTETDLNRIGLYFHQYGYAQNKMMKPNLKSRKRFNYIKVHDCVLKGNGIPKTHLNQIADIFKRGVTLWHMENGNVFGDYTKDNAERS